jgi:TRAP-type C4-dicarboxylate transport system permease small subunit
MEPQSNAWEARIDAVLGVAAAIILFVLMMITFADVVARYLFNFPIRGAFEISELMLLVLIFAGLPLVSHADEHVTMDFIDHMLPGPALRLLERTVHALCAALLFFLAWQVWLKAGKIAAYGDTTDVLRIVVAPFVYFMTAMIGLTGIVHLFKIVYLPAKRGPTGTT